QTTLVQGAPRTGSYSANLKTVPDGSGGYAEGILAFDYTGNLKPLVLSGFWKGNFSDITTFFTIWINVKDTAGNTIANDNFYAPNSNLSTWTSFTHTINYTSSALPG